MRENPCLARVRTSALVVAALALGLASHGPGANAWGAGAALERGRVAAARLLSSAPRGHIVRVAGPARRGPYVPPRPANIDSSPMIDDLNKALKALGATDRDYDGHREKAIVHIGLAIRLLEMPTARGRSNAAVEKAAGNRAVGKGPTTSQADSDASLRKARTKLFAVHHQLADHGATSGRIRADSQVRIAIQELSLALKPSTAAPSPAPGAATAGKADKSRQ